MFGRRVGGFKRRAEEIIEGELAVAPDLVPIFEALMQARRDILAWRGTDHGDGGRRGLR